MEDGSISDDLPKGHLAGGVSPPLAREKGSEPNGSDYVHQNPRPGTSQSETQASGIGLEQLSTKTCLVDQGAPVGVQLHKYESVGSNHQP